MVERQTPPLPHPDVEVLARFPAPVFARLDDLLRTGLFGRSIEDVVERLVVERLRELRQDGGRR